MGKTTQRIDRKIKEEIEREFPGDPALQQIHIARRTISKEAREKGVTLQNYIENYYSNK